MKTDRNGIAEREIRNVLEGTRTLLEHSGLPTSYWPYASRCFCHHANIRMVEGDSAWNVYLKVIVLVALM